MPYAYKRVPEHEFENLRGSLSLALSWQIKMD